MNDAFTRLRRLLAAAALLLPLASLADPVPLFVPFEGAGNVLVIDDTAGVGVWTGRIEQSAFPAVPLPLSLVSVVLFELDSLTMKLVGTFEFTSSADLASTLFGQVNGSYVDLDILTTGGQFGLDYTILGGTGAFLGASGYGLSFLDFDPAGAFDNYTEAGALVITVPEPTTLLLTTVALLGLFWLKRTVL